MGVWWHALAFVTHERAKMSHKQGRNVTQAGPKCHTRAKMSHSHVIISVSDSCPLGDGPCISELYPRFHQFYHTKTFRFVCKHGVVFGFLVHIFVGFGWNFPYFEPTQHKTMCTLLVRNLYLQTGASDRGQNPSAARHSAVCSHQKHRLGESTLGKGGMMTKNIHLIFFKFHDMLREVMDFF